MKVDLTKEQIDFIYYLCCSVRHDYDNYSVKEQREREDMATSIRCALEDASEEIDEEKLDKLAFEWYENTDEEASVEGFKAGYKKAMEE